MNIYMVLPIVAFIANLALGSYILYRDPKSKLNRIYALFAFSMVLWATGDIVVFTYFLGEMTMHIDKISTIGAALVPAFLLHFFLVFTKNRYVNRKAYYLTYIPAAFFIYIRFTTELIVKSIEPVYWGHNYIYGIMYAPLVAYIMGYTILGLIFCYRFYSRTKGKKEKIQAKLLIVAISIPVVGGFLSQGLPPLMGLEIFPLTTTLTTLSAVIISYAMIKYMLMTPPRFSIRNKMIVLFLIVSIIPVAFTGYFFINSMQSSLTDQIHNHLESVAQSRANHLRSFIEEQEENIMIISNIDCTRDLLKLYYEGKDYTDEYEHTRKELNKNFHKEFNEISVIDRQGELVITTNPEGKIGTDFSKDSIFLAGKNGLHVKDVYYDEEFGQTNLAISMPLIDDGLLLGIVFVKIKSSVLNEITLDETGLGETGETYIVNENGYMITDSRFMNNTVLKLKVDTLGSRNCRIDESGSRGGHRPIETYRDYRGVHVLGVRVYIGEMGWCLLTEMNESEAFAPLTEMGNLMLIATLIFALLVVGFATIFSRSISESIIKLRDIVNEIGKGKLDTKIEIKSKDEIGELATSFKRMVIDLKRSQKQVKRHAEELENRVKERTKELDAKVNELTDTKTAVLNMMEDMDEANKELVRTQDELGGSLRELREMDMKKDQFISIAAHELKTPLTSIHGFSQLLQDRKIADNFTKRSKYLKIMDQETKRLAKLVGDMLDLSGIDLGTVKIELSKFSVNELMDSLKKEMDIQIKDKGLESAYDVKKNIPNIETDREKLMEVLLNLISNSVKYTPKGKITVKAFRDKENIHFIVKDTGIGISKENQEMIFDRFYQVDSSYTRKAGGTGLGLALCKEFVELLGGKIWIVSEKGKGSEFHFTLPIRGVPKEHIREAERKSKEKLRKSGKVRGDIERMGFGELNNK